MRFIFGNELRGYDLPLRRDWVCEGLHVGPQQVENLVIAAIVDGLLFAFLSFTRTGKAMRAVADNPMLAAIKGINADMVARLVSFVAMGLAGLGGMLIGLDTTIDPLIGFKTILSIFAAAVVGGLGSMPGRRGRCAGGRRRRGAVAAGAVAGLSHARSAFSPSCWC